MKRSAIELNLPAGFRFHPTDDELVNSYLIQKCASKLLPAPIITEVELYKFDPWQLPELALYGEKEWYFFSPRDRKYPNGSRPNRAAGTGYWKATGADKPIGQPALGIKKALVFYAGKAPGGIKTNWIMHEYRLANVDRSARNKKTSRLDDWVLCRIYNKKGIMEKHVLNQVKNINMEEDKDKKTDVVLIPGFSFNQQNPIKPDIWAPMKTEDHTFSDVTDSIPKLQQESSSSEHAVSPDSQVQSEPRWDELELDKDFDFQFDGFLNDPFCPDQFQFQMDQFSALQDMLQFPQKPF